MNIILADSIEYMKATDNAFDLIITSPPYQVGKKYDESVDIPETIRSMSNILKDNGVIAWQVGSRIDNGFIVPMDIIYHNEFTKLGFKLVNRIIWHFGHGYHCKNRLSGRYETIMIYSRSKKHTFNLDPIRVPQKYPNKKHYKGKNKGKLSGNPLGKNPSDVWGIGNVKNNHPEKTEHPCQFPEELARRIILAFSNEGELVLDPFLGSGTSGIVCKNHNREFVGIDNNENFINIAKDRIENSAL